MIDETYKYDPADIQASTSLAWMSYLWLLFLVPLLVNKNSPFTKFHVNQGIVFFILSLIAGVATRILQFIPFVGWIASSVIGIALLVLMILGIVNAVQGTAKRLPVIGNIEILK